MDNRSTDTQTNSTLSFMFRDVPQPQYEANQAKKGIDAEATISGANDFGRANVDFSNHTNFSDAIAFQPHFGCMIDRPCVLSEEYNMAYH